uniref:WGS project CAEQ00000000 data, annotated contig 984 n=1 Tax=Trypanosoma congolense (strain IL3000) TaxID=1068625 RepID=F9WK42_TRYCI|nr:unnamed protein product [Trypanosoma congolense IL3000]
MADAAGLGGANSDRNLMRVPAGMDPTYYALSLLRRCRFEECVAITTSHLNAAIAAKNTDEQDQQSQSHHRDRYISMADMRLWLIRARALAMRNWFEEIDIDDDGTDDALMEKEQATHANATARDTSHGWSQHSAVAKKNRDTARPISSRCALARPGTRASQVCSPVAKPITSRLVRIGTASVQTAVGGAGCSLQDHDLIKYAREKPITGKVICDYLLHVAHRPRMVLDLCNSALSRGERDWWWLSRSGQAYYRMGLLREAEQQFKAALALQENVGDVLRLAKVFVRMDQPLKALEVLSSAAETNTTDQHLFLAMARLYERLQDTEKSCAMYRSVLQLDSTNVEAIACIASHHFHENQQPELALRLYRRLLQMGVQTAELWNNLGLCCFYSSQYDIALSCLQRAAAVAENDELLANVWYNIGHIGISTGDLVFAERAFHIAVGTDPHHAEALNNLAVLQLRRGNTEAAYSDITMALSAQPMQIESLYNAALIAFLSGLFEQAHTQIQLALDVSPDHPESVELQAEIRSVLATL